MEGNKPEERRHFGGVVYKDAAGEVTVYATKACEQMVHQLKAKKKKKTKTSEQKDKQKEKEAEAKQVHSFSRRGFGWSGLLAAASSKKDHSGGPTSFWVCSDNWSSALFKVNFSTGSCTEYPLNEKHSDLEGMSPVPLNELHDSDALSTELVKEVFVIAGSSSINKTGQHSTRVRNRLSLVVLPRKRKGEKKHKRKLVEGEQLFTWEHVREKIYETLEAEVAANRLNCEVQRELAAKKGGVDIEGICFVPSNRTGTGSHALLLGMRGPITLDKKALIIPVNIPHGSLKDPQQWNLQPPKILDFNGYSIRDMCLWVGGEGRLLVLAGPLWQDKADSAITAYPVYACDLVEICKPTEGAYVVPSSAYKQVLAIPRIPIHKIDHMNLRRKDFGVEGMEAKQAKALRKALADNKEKPTSFSSPEGIASFGDELLVCWDHNDAGLYATFSVAS
ncbi:hypothetical protein QOT17_003327 [Balamuthia mandrillaris]